uniref:Mitochondrial carrier protein n=1 Tax=viral metagenome TaxID=1070528 RepID=A0A6C0I8D5_9ZZZZ
MKQVFNGISAELFAAVLTYPLNTIKTNSQIGRPVKFGFKNLSRGLGWCVLSEITNALLFYSIFDKDKPLKTSIIGSTLGICASYPFNTKRKLAQVGKSFLKLNNYYYGIEMALINGVPGVSLNFTLREHLNRKFQKNKKINGIISTSTSLIATHPLDTLSTCLATRTPVGNIFKFNGFLQRFLEKNLTISTKMLFLS